MHETQDDENLYAEEDYKRLIKAVFDSSLIDYIKLQHSNNRDKKFLQQSFINTVDMFFDEDYRFKHFQDLETQTKDLSFLELMKIYLESNKMDKNRIHEYISKESMSYWWEKNFHNLQVPETITIAGIVWTIKNSPANCFIDHENKRIYCPVNAVESDRIFFKLCLQQICNSAEIHLSETDFDKLFKLFYLFLKINAPFTQRKK
jgi:hypothetical protein